MRELAFKFYIFYLLSFFLRFTARVPELGLIRLDMLLVAVITLLIILGHGEGRQIKDEGGTFKALKALIIFMIVSLPLVKYAGSVVNTGAEGYVKAVIFFFFTVALVTSEKKLRILITVFLACQVIRILEPL